jgi:hypothetical protein
MKTIYVGKSGKRYKTPLEAKESEPYRIIYQNDAGVTYKTPLEARESETGKAPRL